MGRDSGIEWTEHTFNPWRGCQKVSPGCANCYAETLSHRNPGILGEWGPPNATTRVIAAESYWRKPLTWNAQARTAGTPARVFCASLADVFEDAPQVVEARQRLFALIEDTPWLVWLLLTKRPANVPAMTPRAWRSGWPGNVWLGTSAEDQQRAEERIPCLLDVPAATHFLSAEPLLGPVDLTRWLHDPACGTDEVCGCGPRTARRLQWVIVGGESGRGARPMAGSWVRSLRDQCTTSPAHFFFKQWGTHDVDGERVGKRLAGRHLDGRTWSQVPTLAVGDRPAPGTGD